MSTPALEEQFEPTAGDSVEVARARSSWELFRHRFRQDKAAMVGAIILVVLVILALAAPLFARLLGHGPNERFPDQMLTADIGLPKGPNAQFWFGGDSVGRDVFVRTLYGARTSLTVALVATGLAALGDRLERTVVVVSSKSGGTVETDSHRRAAWAAFTAAGRSDAETGQHFVAVTDPGSTLEATAKDSNFRAVFLADPNVGGRYSALSAFGLVPSALAGVDVRQLLDDAAALREELSGDEHNPALDLGLALGSDERVEAGLDLIDGQAEAIGLVAGVGEADRAVEVAVRVDLDDAEAGVLLRRLTEASAPQP